jgi:hypothetical protein
VNPSCLPPINPVLACDHNAIFAQTCWVFQSFPYAKDANQWCLLGQGPITTVFHSA